MSKDFIGALLVAVISSGLWPVIVPKFMERKNRSRREESKRRDRDLDRWLGESEKAFARVQEECDECHKEIQRIRRDEVEPLKQDNAAMKDALLESIAALDEILPYITSLPDEKVRELRLANKARRNAVFRMR